MAIGMREACMSRATSTTSITWKHYGHPSEFGYKDIIPLWKAEKWDPDRLMKPLPESWGEILRQHGSHHDNFFLWNSKLHLWNAVQMGRAVTWWANGKKRHGSYGLKFGVSEHLGASFTWFQSKSPRR